MEHNPSQQPINLHWAVDKKPVKDKYILISTKGYKAKIGVEGVTSTSASAVLNKIFALKLRSSGDSNCQGFDSLDSSKMI